MEKMAHLIDQLKDEVAAGQVPVPAARREELVRALEMLRTVAASGSLPLDLLVGGKVAR